MSDKDRTDSRFLAASSVIIQSIGKGLDSVADLPGKVPSYFSGWKSGAYWHFIESRSGLVINEIPRYPEKLVEAVREILGVRGVPVLKLIVAELRAADLGNDDEQTFVSHFAEVLEEGLRDIEAGIE